jgi:hypothetical protein
MTPALRLVLATFGVIYVFKAVALAIRRGQSAISGCPGVIPDAFQRRLPSQTIDPPRFLVAWARKAVGAAPTLRACLRVQLHPQFPRGPQCARQAHPRSPRRAERGYILPSFPPAL